jgi:hypothetical protein
MRARGMTIAKAGRFTAAKGNARNVWRRVMPAIVGKNPFRQGLSGHCGDRETIVANEPDRHNQ